MRQVFDLADAFDPRYRALVLLAVFCSLRWGELTALRRRHIDLACSTVCIQESVVELTDGSLVTGPPKSLAGRRVVSIPASLLPEILSHLEDFTALGEDALVFTGPKNAQLRRSNFSRAWQDATQTVGLTGFHFHDLRHTGNALAGAAGASLRELMERMGHAPPAPHSSISTAPPSATSSSLTPWASWPRQNCGNARAHRARSGHGSPSRHHDANAG